MRNLVKLVPNDSQTILTPYAPGVNPGQNNQTEVVRRSQRILQVPQRLDL